MFLQWPHFNTRHRKLSHVNLLKPIIASVPVNVFTCVNWWTWPTSHMLSICHWEVKCADAAAHQPARSNYPQSSLPKRGKLWYCLFWLAALPASLCLVWQVAAISQSPTECKAPGYVLWEEVMCFCLNSSGLVSSAQPPAVHSVWIWSYGSDTQGGVA